MKGTRRSARRKCLRGKRSSCRAGQSTPQTLCSDRHHCVVCPLGLCWKAAEQFPARLTDNREGRRSKRILRAHLFPLASTLRSACCTSFSTSRVMISVASLATMCHTSKYEAIRLTSGSRLCDERRSSKRLVIVRSAMGTQSKPAIVARNPDIVPKQRCIEPLPDGYAVRELCTDWEGYYWYVVTAFELIVLAKPIV